MTLPGMENVPPVFVSNTRASTRLKRKVSTMGRKQLIIIGLGLSYRGAPIVSLVVPPKCQSAMGLSCQFATGTMAVYSFGSTYGCSLPPR